MNLRFPPVLPALAALLVLGGCAKPAAPETHDDHDGHGHASAGHDHDEPGHEEHDHHHDTDESPSVTFRGGRGLRLPAETAAALGVQTAVAAEQEVTPAWEVTAAVFDAGPPARASVLVPAGLADVFERHPPAGFRLLAVQRDLAPAINQAELLLELPDRPAAGSTLGLTLRGPDRPALTVPPAALLRAATGTFVYVVRGEFLLRTPVRAGVTDGDHTEILDGLRAGDLVVTAAVEQLWLTELRLTKGGGHSH